MKLRKIALTLVVLLSALSLFAAEVSITWEWEKNDADVNYFRYQIDSESPEGWTVVPADVTAYTADGLDGSVGYTLYLQQSYDGEYWSASAAVTSDPVVPAVSEVTEETSVTESTEAAPEESGTYEEPPVAVTLIDEPVALVEENVALVEEPVVVDSTPVAVVEETPVAAAVVEEPVAVVDEEVPAVVEEETPVEEAVAEEPVVEEAEVIEVAVEKTSAFQFTTDFGGGIGYGFGAEKTANVNLSFDFENIAKAGPIGFDIRTDFGAVVHNALPLDSYTSASTIFQLESYNFAAYGDFELGLNATFGKFMMYGAVGARLQVGFMGYEKTNAFKTFNDNIALKAGVTVDAGMRFNFTKVFGLAVEESYTYLFDKLDRHMLDTKVLMTLTF